MSKKIPYEHPKEGTRVRVYWNLHKHCYSFQSTESGRVIAHYDRCTLSDAKLIVRKAGNEKVRREGKKNVHAFAVGFIAEPDSSGAFDADILEAAWITEVTYNPYKYTSFVDKDTEEPIEAASLVEMSSINKGHVTVPFMTAVD